MQYYQRSVISQPVPLAIVALNGITHFAELGMHPKDKGHAQKLKVDIAVGFDDAVITAAGPGCATPSGLDAGVIRAAVLSALSTEFDLLETAANRITSAVLLLPQVLTVEATITKSFPWADTESTSLTVSREKT